MLVAPVALAILAAATRSASAANWHNYANNPPCSIGTYHGMKQGDLNDDFWQAVVNGGECGYHKMCRAGSFYYGSGGGDETYGVDRSCIGTMNASHEYYGWGRTFADTPNGVVVIETHYHCSHQRGGCP